MTSYKKSFYDNEFFDENFASLKRFNAKNKEELNKISII